MQLTTIKKYTQASEQIQDSFEKKCVQIKQNSMEKTTELLTKNNQFDQNF